MTPEYRAALLTTAKALPLDCVVPVPAGRLLELLAGSEGPTVTPDAPPPDFTVAQVAARFDRDASTVRGWISSGLLAAYRFVGNELRITPTALADFEARQRPSAPDTRPSRNGGGRNKAPDLGEWRKVAS